MGNEEKVGGRGWDGEEKKKREMASNWFKSIAAVKSNSNLRQRKRFA